MSLKGSLDAMRFRAYCISSAWYGMLFRIVLRVTSAWWLNQISKMIGYAQVIEQNIHHFDHFPASRL